MIVVILGSWLQLAACGGSAFTTSTEGPGTGASGAAGKPEPTAGALASAGTSGRAGTAGSNAEAGAAGAVGEAGSSSAGAESVGYREVILADRPLAYWRMGEIEDQSIPDETGGGNALVLQGGGHVPHSPGAVLDDPMGALGFDGEKSFAIANEARAFDFPDSAPFTLECWAQWVEGGPSYFQYLISNVQGIAGNRDGYSLYLLPAPALLDNAATAFEYDRPGADVGTRGPIPAVGAWAHYATVFDGKKIALFVDGTLANSANVTGSIGARTSSFAVGRHSDSDGFFFKGAIDEVAVYGRALRVADIARHISVGKYGP